MRVDSIEGRLEEMERRLDVLPTVEQPPPTTLQILGQSTQERDWQQLLLHFLTPDGPHGLGRDLLVHLLSGLASREDLRYDFSRLDLDTIGVAQEVTTRRGRPDVIIWSAEDWFICFELKVDAEEGDDQTERYVAVDAFDGIGLHKESVPDDRRHYVYLAPDDASPPTADEFVHISWELIASSLQSFLAESYGEYPARTTAQLEDFIDTIRSELTMTDYEQNQRAKMELYVEHSQAINEVESAFETGWEEFKQDWGDRLASSIESGTAVNAPGVPDEFAIFAFENSGDRWIFRQTHDDWAWIIKDGWWRNAETGDPVYTYDASRPDTRVGFVHRLEKHRDDALLNNELKFFFRNAPPNVDSFSDTFVRGFVDDPGRDQIIDALPDRMELTGRSDSLLEGTYEIETTKDRNFLDAYLDALAEAFLDNVVKNEGLIDEIDKRYAEAYEAINDSS